MFGSWLVAVGEGLRSGGLGGGAAGPSLGPPSVLSPLPVCGAARSSQPWLQYHACIPDHAPCHGDDDELSGTGSPK